MSAETLVDARKWTLSEPTQSASLRMRQKLAEALSELTLID